MDQAWTWVKANKGKVILGSGLAAGLGVGLAAGWLNLDQARAILAALGLGVQ